MNVNISKSDIIKYCDLYKQRYSLWVYDGNDVIQVYEEKRDNTKQIWFQFRVFSHLYWKMMQSECVDEVKGNSFYNFTKIKYFMLSYLLCGTNIPEIKFIRNQDGTLVKQQLDKVMKIHPRILRALFDKINIFSKGLDAKQEKQLQKQCLMLFGKGKSINNPHKWISLYCNLEVFWEKLGLNYFDLLKLPNDTFNFLRKMINLQNDYHSQSLQKQELINKSRSNKGVKF